MRLRALLLRAAPSGAPRRPPASPATPGDPRRPPASSGVLLRQHVHRRPVRRAPALLHASAFEQHPHTVVHALHRQPGSPGDVLQPVPRLQPHKRGREIRRHGVHIRGDDKIPRLPPRRQFLRSHHRRLPAPRRPPPSDPRSGPTTRPCAPGPPPSRPDSGRSPPDCERSPPGTGSWCSGHPSTPATADSSQPSTAPVEPPADYPRPSGHCARPAIRSAPPPAPRTPRPVECSAPRAAQRLCRQSSATCQRRAWRVLV
jgi:hypothetical protein